MRGKIGAIRKLLKMDRGIETGVRAGALPEVSARMADLCHLGTLPYY